MRVRILAVAVGVAACLLVVATRWASPMNELPAPGDRVTAVVRNNLGQLRWVATEPTDYTPLEASGRRVYLRAGCMYCHSQYVRPVAVDTRPWGPVSADSRRWGPIAEPGEYAFDVPHLFGPGGVGPDLSREGLKYSGE